jgi:VRR-NUC domain
MKKQTKFYKPAPVELNPAILHYGEQSPYNGEETALQRASAGLVAHLNLPLAYHTANESRRPGRAGDVERMQNKLQGVLPGAADWCIPHKTSAGHPGSYIELKVKGGKLSQDQIKFLNGVYEQGYFCGVVWNIEAFQDLLKNLYQKNKV